MISRRTLVATAGGAVVLALAAFVSFLGVAELPFYTKGEPREALVVWEMAHDGGLVLPLRNGDEVPSKPPLFHWLALVAASVIGEVNELATRLPSGSLAVAVTVAVYAFAAAVGRIRSGWLAAIALIFSFEWLRAARTARVDMTFSAFVATSLLLFATMSRSGATAVRRCAFWAALAAATLAKGPIGLVLPSLVIVIYALSAPSGGTEPQTLGKRVARVGETLRELRAVRGLAAVGAVVGAWYAAAWWVGGDAFLETHAFRENVFRVLDADRFGSGHSHGPFYLFGQLFLGAFPWSLSLPAIAWWLWADRPLDDTKRFLVVWFLVIFAFFLVPDSKRGVYLLPAYPAGALLFGLVLGPGPEGTGPRRLAAAGWITGCVALALVGLVAVVAATGLPVENLVLPHLRAHEAAEVQASLATLREPGWWTAGLGLVVLVGSAAAALNARGAHWLRASVPLSAAFAIALAGLVLPVERAIAHTRALGPFLAQVRAEVGDASIAFGEGSFDYGAVFYADRHVPRSAEARSEATFLLVFEDRPGGRDEDADVVLRSEETGARSRARLLLIRNGARRPSVPAPTDAGRSGAD